MGRVATARAGSTHRANSTINFAIEKLLKFESFFCFYSDLREKIRVIYEETMLRILLKILEAGTPLGRIGAWMMIWTQIWVVIMTPIDEDDHCYKTMDAKDVHVRRNWYLLLESSQSWKLQWVGGESTMTSSNLECIWNTVIEGIIYGKQDFLFMDNTSDGVVFLKIRGQSFDAR